MAPVRPPVSPRPRGLVLVCAVEGLSFPEQASLQITSTGGSEAGRPQAVLGEILNLREDSRSCWGLRRLPWHLILPSLVRASLSPDTASLVGVEQVFHPPLRARKTQAGQGCQQAILAGKTDPEPRESLQHVSAQR